MGNRRKATAYILDNLALIEPGNRENVELTRKNLEALTDEQFAAYMAKLRKPANDANAKDQEVLCYFAPNLADTKITLDQNLAVAAKIGHNFFEQLWVTDAQTGRTYKTPEEYCVVDLPIRRQAQHQEKKATIPLTNNSVDELSGQPTGDSKGSKLSFPELQAQVSQNLEHTIIEEIKLRGGDEKAWIEFERSMIEKGTVSQAELLRLKTTVKSTETLSVLLTGMHLKNNLIQ